jgi:hypothetical protein
MALVTVAAEFAIIVNVGASAFTAHYRHGRAEEEAVAADPSPLTRKLSPSPPAKLACTRESEVVMVKMLESSAGAIRSKSLAVSRASGRRPRRASQRKVLVVR